MPRLAAELPVALALAVVAALLYGFTWQTRFFGDGPGLQEQFLRGEGRNYQHALFHPVSRLLQDLFGGDSPVRGLHLTSILGASAGIGFGWLVMRGCGATRFGSLVGSALLLLSPSLWFFGTTIEVHALIFGVGAMVAAVILWAPWQRPALALALVTAVFPLLFLAHQSSFVAGPGLLLLAQFARARRDRPWSWRALLLGVGPLLLAALCVGGAISWALRFDSIQQVRDELTWQLGREYYGPEYPVWRDEWLLPLGLLTPLALAGLVRLRSRPRLCAALGTLIGVPLAFFLWWRTVENGGYFLQCALYFATASAFLFTVPRPSRVLLALLAVASQGLYAHHRIADRDRGWDPSTHAAQVRSVLGESGLLLTTTYQAPSVTLELPGIEDTSLVMLLLNTCRFTAHRLITPEEAVSGMQRFFRQIYAKHEHVAFDLSFHDLRPDDTPYLQQLRPHLAAIEQYLRETFVVREVPHPDWPLLVLERRR